VKLIFGKLLGVSQPRSALELKMKKLRQKEIELHIASGM
jgi:hypothetical protein